MTNFGSFVFAALTVTASTLALPALAPALASATPALGLVQTSDGPIAPVELDVSSGPFNFAGFKSIDFNCRDYNNGQYPYLAFDILVRFFQPITYFTGDGLPIGHYIGEIKPNGRASGGSFTGATATVSLNHKTVTFYCAQTKAAANQYW